MPGPRGELQRLSTRMLFYYGALFVYSSLAAFVSAAADSDPALPLLSFRFDTNASKWRQWFKQSETTSCPGLTIPDQAMAAFRRDDGSVVALIDTYALRGPSITELQHNCSSPPTIRANFTKGTDPSVFPHAVWLTATWTADGETIHGLVHDEYHPKLCPHQTCWMTTVLAVKSTDGGHSFEYVRTKANPRAIALASPLPYEASFTHAQGLPNNHIVQDPRDGWICEQLHFRLCSTLLCSLAGGFNGRPDAATVTDAHCVACMQTRWSAVGRDRPLKLEAVARARTVRKTWEMSVAGEVGTVKAGQRPSSTRTRTHRRRQLATSSPLSAAAAPRAEALHISRAPSSSSRWTPKLLAADTCRFGTW